MSAYDFSFTSIDGGPLPLEQFRGKVLLVVNTASFCGFTPQYDGLEQVYKTYKDKGLVVIGVPANDFGAQEPGSNADIKSFCTTRFDIDFPMAQKVTVVGKDAHPFYLWATGATGSPPKWNFHKYLVGKDGAVIGSYPSAVKPTAKELTGAIEAALAK